MSHHQGSSKHFKVRRPSEAWWGLLVLAILAGGIGNLVLHNQPQQGSGVEQAETSAPNNEPLALLTASAKTQQAVAHSQLDPSQDGWETEVVAEQAKKQLTSLAQRLSGQDLAAVISTQVSAEVTSGPLRPGNIVEAFREGTDGNATVVRRAAKEGPLLTAPAEVYHGQNGLKKAFDELAMPLTGASDIHLHVKVVRVTITPTSAETKSYFEASGRTGNPTAGSLQQRATWECQWERSQGKLSLKSIRATDYEEVLVEGPWLVDRTNAVLGANSSFREQLAFGHHHWLSRLSRSHGISTFTRSGFAVGDVNGDGFDDIYVCQPGGLPNRLFVQQSDGTAIDRSNSAGVDWLDHTSSALLVDLDNDGDQDLIVSTTAGLLLMDNDSRGSFRLQLTLATGEIDTQSLSAVDYDQDGDLDLYVCIEFANQNPIEGAQFVYHDANDGAANLLFRNDIATNRQADDWSFANVTEQVGLDVDNRRHSLACAWEDYDNDGDQDLYVANDYGQNCLYRNENGRFKNVATEANAVDSASGMSVSWGDYNHDGFMDLYVANMFSSAGNRITRQSQFKPDADQETRNIYSRFAKGNTLLQNDGQGKFQEVSASAGVEMGRWAWSSVFADLNNDSLEDLLVANGYITTDDTGDL